MFHSGRRPMGRLFYWIVIGILAWTHPFAAASPVPGPPTLTTVADTVYRADGTPAQGNLIITWPAFVTATGTAVAAGNVNVTLGANGALSVGLAPNAGASTVGLYYTVVFQLGPGEVRTEYWVVPTTSPANLAAVRTTPGSGTAAQSVSMQYVNTALATKANDSSMVHLSGSETISGTKSFAVAPSVPAPLGTGDVANKAYVDTSVANVGAGNFLPTAGGTLTGPLTLKWKSDRPIAGIDEAVCGQCVGRKGGPDHRACTCGRAGIRHGELRNMFIRQRNVGCMWKRGRKRINDSGWKPGDC